MGLLVERIPVPDVRQPMLTPSLPVWIVSRLASLSREEQRDDKTGRYQMVDILPPSSILTLSQRDEVERYIASVNELCEHTPENSANAQRETLEAVKQLMLTIEMPGQTVTSVEARTMAFMVALGDVPSWAVVSAVLAWARGGWGTDSRGEPFNYRWCPAQAELRTAAMRAMWPLKETIAKLQRLLKAKPAMVFDEGHCERMREKFEGLVRELKAKNALDSLPLGDP
jgi:hypothetical protein